MSYLLRDKHDIANLTVFFSAKKKKQYRDDYKAKGTVYEVAERHQKIFKWNKGRLSGFININKTYLHMVLKLYEVFIQIIPRLFADNVYGWRAKEN